VKAVRAGVVGVGRLGREHARILAELPEAELVGVHDRRKERGRSVADELGTPHHDRPEPLLERAEAVVIAVPTHAHHAVARTALEAGCHALVEKPLTRTVAEADDLIDRAESRGLALGVGHVERFNDAVRGALPHLEDPRFIESLRLAPFQRRGTDVTVVLDLMIHDIDLVLGLVRSPLTSLHAVGTPVVTSSLDIANARLVFENGCVAEITASRISEEPTRMLRLFQSSGYLRLDLARGVGEFLRRRETGAPDGTGGVPGGAIDLEDIVERIPLTCDGAEPLRLQLLAFLRAVRGEVSSLVSARDGRAALEIAHRIHRQVARSADVAVEA